MRQSDSARAAAVRAAVHHRTEHARQVEASLGRDGFIAVAPDLISGFGPGGGNIGHTETVMRPRSV